MLFLIAFLVLLVYLVGVFGDLLLSHMGCRLTKVSFCNKSHDAGNALD